LRCRWHPLRRSRMVRAHAVQAERAEALIIGELAIL
jgi:hypothetical protein